MHARNQYIAYIAARSWLRIGEARRGEKQTMKDTCWGRGRFCYAATRPPARIFVYVSAIRSISCAERSARCFISVKLIPRIVFDTNVLDVMRASAVENNILL